MSTRDDQPSVYHALAIDGAEAPSEKATIGSN
jgi:hypothetical protein